MTYESTADCIRAEQEDKADKAREDLYLDGSTDAAFGRLPEFADETYLAGYIAKLKELPQDAAGRIRYDSPRKHFAFGYMDGVGNAIDGESNDEF